MFSLWKRKKDEAVQEEVQSSGKGGLPRVNKKLGAPASRIIYWICLSMLILGIVIVLLFNTDASGRATVFEWMMACFLAGTFIGFLFGIPKILQGGSAALPINGPGNTSNNNQVPPGSNPSTNSPIPGFTYQQQVNTNLTEISDWLTKIIVGLGLVNLTKIPPYLSATAKILAEALTHNARSVNTLPYAFAYGTIVSYVILGFLFGYISTRLYLAGAFLDADRRSLDIEQLTSRTDELQSAIVNVDWKAQIGLAQKLTSPEEIRSLQTGTQGDTKLQELINEYNRIRRDMPYGDLRTSRMTDVASQMTVVAPLVANFDIANYLKESDNGKRLAGYTYLISKPDYSFLPDIVESILKDPTQFGQYWAIQVLGKLLALQPNNSLDTELYKKLKTYYDKLPDGVDRKYELGKMIPSLKSN